jgi:type I restriction enzyme S subunit
MTELPHGWSRATIEEIAGDGGLTADGDWIETKDQDPNGEVRLIQLADIGDGEFRDRSARFVNNQTAHRLNCTFLEKNDLLIARMPDPLGRACIFPGVGQPAITAVDVFICRPSPGGPLARWLMHFVNSADVRSRILEQAAGTTRQRIAGGRVKQLLIPVPPLPEQRRIVAKIDSLSGKSKRARAQLDHISRLVENYKQAILSASFRGALTKSCRTRLDENLSSGPWAIPAEWKWLTVAGVGVVSLGRQRSPKDHSGPQMRRYVRAANITWRGWNLDDVKEMNFDDNEFARFKLRPGDVLLNEGSGSAKEVGKPAIWQGEIEDCCFQNTLLRVQPAACSSEFLYRYFLFCALTELFVSSTQGVNIYHIGKEGLARFPVPLPPRQEQDEIVRLIEKAFTWIERLATEATSARKLIDHLDQAILAKAFRGELVPQDPNDEPASVLLERIRAQRQTTSTMPSRKKQSKPRRGRKK